MDGGMLGNHMCKGLSLPLVALIPILNNNYPLFVWNFVYFVYSVVCTLFTKCEMQKTHKLRSRTLSACKCSKEMEI